MEKFKKHHYYTLDYVHSDVFVMYVTDIKDKIVIGDLLIISSSGGKVFKKGSRICQLHSFDKFKGRLCSNTEINMLNEFRGDISELVNAYQIF